MSTSQQDEQRLRRTTLDHDRRLREEQGSTFLAQTHSEIGGRFAQVGAQTVVGAEPVPNYPAAAAHQRDPCGIEPPLGYSVNELEPSIAATGPVEAQAGGPVDAPSSPLDVEHTGPSLSSKFDRRF
jgi:hypothetical protein